VESQRLDKWLWCARLVKTRTLSARLVEAGKVRVNGTRILKPARPVAKGDVITASLGRVVIVRVIGAADRRVSPSLARLLYEDLTPAEPPREAKPVSAGRRPTKRDRRKIDALLLKGE
jgi:ribosome-associated heat shock protein Hsp15